MITIMNISNIIVDKCVLLTFAPPTIPLMYITGQYLNAGASLNRYASLSLISAMDVPGIAKLHVL